MESDPSASVPPAGKNLVRGLVLAFTLLVGAVIGAIAVALAASGTIYDYRDSITIERIGNAPVDVIVVLAGARGRIEYGADFWYRYRSRLLALQERGERIGQKPPYLYVSGMGHQADFEVFRSQVKPEVLDLLESDRVVLENESTSTHENAIYFKEQAQRRSWDKILLVTSSYHMKRAHYIFEKELRDTKIEIRTLSIHQPPFSPDEWRKSVYGIEVTLIEYLKWIYYLAAH